LLARQVPDVYAPLRVGSTATGVKGSKQLKQPGGDFPSFTWRLASQR
jgi:hypothetical protein